MANQVYQSQKVELRFSRKSIDNSARRIRHGCNGAERIDAIEKIQNFREFHMYPLMLMKNHLARTSKKVGKTIIVARRLKRLPTIINKLERPTLDGKSENGIKLTRMQDIGGCRAIVQDLHQLTRLHNRLKSSRSVHKIVHTSDYLVPKPSGYGGIHLVYSCFHDTQEENAWKKTKIEVQLRTQLQHAWATSLEIIDTIMQINLKTSMDGHDNWRRFFSVAGQLVAHDEKAITLLPEQLAAYQRELNELENELDVTGKLLKFSLAIKATTSRKNAHIRNNMAGMCLVVMRKEDANKVKENEDGTVSLLLQTKIFKMDETHEALKALNESELDPSILLSVLLSTSDAKTLKKAYPNYFGSATGFTRFINKHTTSTPNA